MSAHPYAGLKIVEIADHVGGEYLGRLFAELGAEVTKLEPPAGSATRHVGPYAGGAEGPENSLTFWYYNTNKKSVLVDLASGDPHAALVPFLADADMLIVTFQPGVLRQLGLDLDRLSQDFPRLVIVSMTPYGLTGPWADYRSSDLVALAAGGPLHMCGYDDHSIPPIMPGGPQAHHTTAAFAHIAVMAALIERQTTGLGQLLDVSMHSASALNTELGNPFWLYNRVPVLRQTCRHAQPVMTQSPMYECADGSYVYYTLILADQHSWKILVAWMDELGMAAMLTEPAYGDVLHRQANMGQIQELVESFFLIQNGHDAYLEGQRRGLPIGIVNAPEELLDDEHLKARGFFVPVETDTAHGTVLYPGESCRYSAFGAVERRRAPRLGEDG
ncbi:CaiB/BaiF CoA transferase family protein [Aquibium microcysteis]|uniref:CaiB/BaiF CoA transferase family protein n=1 Tax=Aquibium microcysteis TaxID=675281 RepID=UPI00165D0037|nr:CoA transferase [Aquibium microcysteis]